MKLSVSRVLIAGAAVCVAGVGIVAIAMPAKITRVVEIYDEAGIEGIYYRIKARVPGSGPNTHWPMAEPEEVGLAGPALEALRQRLAAQGASIFLVARDNRLVLEWYSPSYGVNQQQALSALGKGATASLLLLAALSDGLVDLDEPVAEYIPAWNNDPRRSRITLRHLASHSSGIEDIPFTAEHFGWKNTYVNQPETRFGYAIERAPLLFDPGTQAEYSGVAFYVVAYALGRALQDAGEYGDVKSYLRDRVMKPIDIPIADWTISDGESYEIDGMTLYSIGSSGTYTPRALATIGELLVRRGEWNGQQVLDPEWVTRALKYADSPPALDRDQQSLAAGLGWWVNSLGYFRSLPKDAAVAAGANSKILLIVPSLHLVAVWMSDTAITDGSFWAHVESELFEPLMGAIITTASTD